MAGRYLVTETPEVTLRFNTLDVVTVAIYTMAGVAIVLPPGDEVCAEIATTGVFVWDTSLLPVGTISTTGLTRLLFVMTNGLLVAEDTLEWGGWMDRVVGMVQENTYIDDTSFDAVYGGLTSARLRVYTDGSVLGGAVGVVVTYRLTAVPNGINQYSHFEIEKV